jgi:two-component system sensor histidine kinase/response regulator
MVVDDHPSNVLLLQQMLERKGYGVRPFQSGREALESARRSSPDLILLDINMPGLNGYETCKLFKQDPALAAIPVIFLSANSLTAGKMEAFRSGGVDYISKPFEFDEVHARVETHLQLSALQNRLRDQNAQLESIVEERTRELAEAHAQLSRMDQAKSDFLRMISHELRTPLNGLLGAAELILSEVESTAHFAELADMLGESRQRILSLVDSAVLLTQVAMEGGRFHAEPLPLTEILKAATGRAERLAAARRVRLQIPQFDSGWTSGDRELLTRAWQALLETAVKFSIAGDTVTVTANESEVVIDAPSGTIPGAALSNFFHPFGISEASTSAGSLGLDPAMAKRILSLWGNAVEIGNLAPCGVRITVRGARAALRQSAGVF